MRNPTGYYRPKTIDEVVRLLNQPHIKTVILSGGALRLGETSAPDYEAVIDVQAIPTLYQISLDEGRGVIDVGAAASLQQVIEAASVPGMLKDVIRRVVPVNRRNAVSLAELLEFPHKMPEVVAALIALDATVVFALPEESSIRLVDLLAGAMGHQGKPERELMLRVELSRPGPWQTWGVAAVSRTPADMAIVSAAAVVEANEGGIVQSARLALSGVWPQVAGLAEEAAQALQGELLDEPAIVATLAVLAREVAPVADYQGSVSYRQAMASVTLRRALLACRDRLNA